MINRRKLIKMGLAASTLAMLPIGCIIMSDDNSKQLLRPISDSDFPINPHLTGELTDEEFNALASLAIYVNSEWQLVLDMDAYLNVLRSDLKLKTSIEPSYLTEYKNAVNLINGLIDKNEDSTELWSILLFLKFSEPDFESTQLGRARKFVFSEMIKHFVPISGAFKVFGLWNYNGFFGGPYLSDESYRKMFG